MQILARESWINSFSRESKIYRAPAKCVEATGLVLKLNITLVTKDALRATGTIRDQAHAFDADTLP